VSQVLSKKREARKVHRVSAMTALKEEKKFNHARRAEAAWYTYVYVSTKVSVLLSPLNTNLARVTQLLWTSRRSFDIRRQRERRRGRNGEKRKENKAHYTWLHHRPNDTHDPSAEGWSCREGRVEIRIRRRGIGWKHCIYSDTF